MCKNGHFLGAQGILSVPMESFGNFENNMCAKLEMSLLVALCVF